MTDQLRCPSRVKNGPDALEMGCLYYPRKQTSVTYAATVVGARSGAHSFLYARAATWIDGTMLRADQVPLSKAESAEASVARLLLE